MQSRIKNHSVQILVESALWMMAVLSGIQGCTPIVKIRPVATITQPSITDGRVTQGSYAEVNGEYEQLPADIPRTIKKVHWGLLSISASDTTVLQREPIHANALAPDGRTIEILAWELRKGVIAITLQGGRFGSRELESVFITRLQKVLSGKPMPHRGGTFVIPE